MYHSLQILQYLSEQTLDFVTITEEGKLFLMVDPSTWGDLVDTTFNELLGECTEEHFGPGCLLPIDHGILRGQRL